MQTKKYARRRNRKIIFDEDRYIEKYYMKDGKAVIPLDLDTEEDLYMKHDHKRMELSNSVCDYIEEIAYMVPVNVDIAIEIHCPKTTAKQKEKIKQTIKNNYGMEIDETEYDISVSNRKSIILLVVGIIFLIGYIILDRYYSSTILEELLCIFWWVAIWNVIEIQTLDKVELKDKRLNFQQLYEANITFVTEDEEKEEN